MLQKFNFQELELKGVFLINSFFSEDNRGGFVKDYSTETFNTNNIKYELKEVFYTISQKGVVRGMHFQREIQQPKLVRCISGHVYDVVVDLRVNSPTFKKWIGVDLIGNKYNEILIPSGFAHGYMVLEDSIVSYKCGERFYAEYDDGIIWNDKDLGIKWPIEKIGGINNVILSEKDKELQTFVEFVDKYQSL